MTLSRPSSFHVLARSGYGPFQREQTIGEDGGDTGELAVCIDNSQHLWAFLCRGSGSFVAAPNVASGSGNLADQPIKTSTTGSWVEKLTIPVEISAGRYGASGSLIDVQIEHQGGTLTSAGGSVRVRAMNEARSTTYDTITTSTRTTRTTDTGTLDISGAGSSLLLAVDLQWDGATGSEGRLWRVTWQAQEIVLADM